MLNKDVKKQKWALASVALDDVFTDFILSRQAMLCTPKTISFYRFTLGKIIGWLKAKAVNLPEEITSRHVRAYLAELHGKNLSDSYIHSHARVFRTFTRFLFKENYIDTQIRFDMPSIEKKRLHFLSRNDLSNVLSACKSPRDKAMILLLVDSGIRRGEVSALNWGDIDISNGIVRIWKGKGKKYRTVIIGVTTRRALLKYRRSVVNEDKDPLFQTRSGTRLTSMGIRSAILRIGKRSGVKVTPHALRRTFATLSLKAGMNLVHLQGLLGHSSIEMTRQYIQILDEDLLLAHKEHGPIDNFL